VKIALYVEGYTERALSSFLKRWLDQKLAQRVDIRPVRFSGSGDYQKTFARRANKDLAESDLIAVIGLLDLYGVRLDFPKGLSTNLKCDWAKAELERQGPPRFKQHFAVHETEAWLLSDPSIFAGPIGRRLESYQANPESVDLQEPPSKLLKRVYATEGRDYQKVTEGSKLLSKLDPGVAYAKCPHLRMLLDDMLTLV
jgi:Domain of unknown function (DUF4276)